MFDGETLGWILWSILAIPGLILIVAGFGQDIATWRYMRALERGEIKRREPEPEAKVRYDAAPLMGANRNARVS